MSYSAILGPVDNAFYYVDTAQTPMNIGALVIHEGHIEFNQLVRLIDSRIHRAPRYLQRVIQAPFSLGQPTWVDDPHFQITNHIRRVKLPAPGTDAQLRELTGHLLSSMLDRSKPLWEVYLIEGLPGKTALFYKVHHCMVDGLAAVEIFTLLMDFDDQPHPIENRPFFEAEPLPEPGKLIWDSLQREWPHRFGLIEKLGKEAARIGAGLFDPKQRLKMLVAVAHIINGNLRPIRKLAINGKNSGDQQLVWSEFPLEDIHAIRRKVGASVNDVMLAILTGAVEKYEKRHVASDQSFLRILMPVSIRAEDEKGDYGNRISVLPVDIPLEVSDPLERLRSVVKFSTVMKESMLSLTMDLVLTLPSLMPAPVQPGIWGLAPVAFSLLAHTWCTNVAASPLPVYLLGHKMEHVYGYFPLNPSMGLACVIVSYCDKITMTLVIDRAIIRQVDGLDADLKAAFADLREAAGLKPVPPVIAAPPTPTEQPVAIQPEPIVLPTEAPPASAAAPEAQLAPVFVEAISNNGHGTGSAVSSVLETAVVTETPSSNGASAHVEALAPQVEPPAPAPAPQPISKPASLSAAPTKHKLFSEEWAQAFRVVINNSAAYRAAGANWTSGALAFVLNPAPRYGYASAAAVLMDLHRGECKAAHALSQTAALEKAAFVIAGEYAAWMEVLSGKTSPLVMLTTGKLALKKGSMLRLMPHTKSAGELVNCARQVPWA